MWKRVTVFSKFREEIIAYLFRVNALSNKKNLKIRFLIQHKCLFLIPKLDLNLRLSYDRILIIRILNNFKLNYYEGT